MLGEFLHARKVPPDVFEVALETAYLQIKALQGPVGPLAVGDGVVFRSLGGFILRGPLTVVSMDAKTAVMRGMMNDRTTSVELRVERHQLVRVSDVHGLLAGILGETFPCPICNGENHKKN